LDRRNFSAAASKQLTFSLRQIGRSLETVKFREAHELLSCERSHLTGAQPMTTPHQHENAATWLRLIRAEYLEMPGLQLTKPQIQRLWRLDPPTCDALVDALVSDQFLRRTRHAAYVLADSGR
jgi:hypothetical protein